MRSSAGAAVFFSERDRRRHERELGGPTRFAASDRRFGPRRGWRDDASLPADPDELESVLRKKAESENPPPEDRYTLEGEMLAKISSLLYGPTSSPALRAALYRVMARIEGVELVGEVADPLGRPGIALSRPGGYGNDPTTEVRLIVDPRSAEVLAEQTILVAPVDWVDAEPPVVFSEIVFLETAWVGSAAEAAGRR